MQLVADSTTPTELPQRVSKNWAVELRSLPRERLTGRLVAIPLVAQRDIAVCGGCPGQRLRRSIGGLASIGSAQ